MPCFPQWEATAPLLACGLSGLYAISVFRNLFVGLIAALAFAGVYTLIYLLMRPEDYALVIGACTAFAAIAVTMFATRNIDWYGESRKE